MHFEKARQVLKRETVDFRTPLSLASFFYTFHDLSSFFEISFVAEKCHSNWSKLSEPKMKNPNNITCSGRFVVGRDSAIPK